MDVFSLIMLIISIPMFLGLLAVAYIAGRRRRLTAIDYKDRWLRAVNLLGETSRLTDEEVRSITVHCSPSDKNLVVKPIDEMESRQHKRELMEMKKAWRAQIEANNAKANAYKRIYLNQRDEIETVAIKDMYGQVVTEVDIQDRQYCDIVDFI